jgi:hypothetical protein
MKPGMGELNPPDGKGAGFESWSLALIIAVVSGAFVALYILYWGVISPRLGSSCDRRLDAKGNVVCTNVKKDDSPSTVEVPFVRVTPPGAEAFAWSAASAALMTLTLLVMVPSTVWWRELRRDLRPRRWARVNLMVPVMLMLFVTGLILSGKVASSGFEALAILAAIPTFISWTAAIPAMAGTLDVHATATFGHPKLEDVTTNLAAAKSLRSYLDRFVRILGLQIAAWLVWYGAWLRLGEALRITDLERQGGNAAPLNASIIVLVYGAILTGLLAIGFAAGSTALDRRAKQIAEMLIARNRGRAESEEAQTPLAAYYEEMGVERSQRSRFEASVAIAAPLIGGIFSQFVA